MAGKLNLKGNGKAVSSATTYLVAGEDGTVVGSLTVPPLATARNSEKGGRPYVYGPLTLLHQGKQVENRNCILWVQGS
jgi:hypothetical protein